MQFLQSWRWRQPVSLFIYLFICLLYIHIVTYVTLDFHVYGSMHHWSILIIVQLDATQNRLFIILQVHSTCFRCQPHPSSGVHKTVTAASGTGHIFLCSCVVTVLCTPDDGCGWYLKHVEWTCRIIHRLLCVASRWTIINIWHWTCPTIITKKKLQYIYV